MGIEDWVIKGTKLITNIKNQRLKIYSRGWILKNTILKQKKKKETLFFKAKNSIYIYF